MSRRESEKSVREGLEILAAGAFIFACIIVLLLFMAIPNSTVA